MLLLWLLHLYSTCYFVIKIVQEMSILSEFNIGYWCIVLSSELWRVVSLCSACHQFTETAEEVFNHNQPINHYYILLHFVTLLHWRSHNNCFFNFHDCKVVSVLEKRKIEADEKERKVFVLSSEGDELFVEKISRTMQILMLKFQPERLLCFHFLLQLD